MDRKQIIYVVIALAVLVGVVYLLKYSGGKKKSDDEPEQTLPSEDEQKPAESKPRSDGMGREDQQEPGEKPGENGRPKAMTDKPADEPGGDDEVVLKPGDKGDSIKELQRRLMGYDLDIEITGEYDQQTTDALSHLGLSGEISLFDVPDLDKE